MLHSTPEILYVRASLRPFAFHIRQAGGVIEFLQQTFSFDEIFVPHFCSTRPFWRPVEKKSKVYKSGALGKNIAAYPQSIISSHPSHSFAGVGPRVKDVLGLHDHNTSCFFPISELASRHDFSMLLLACVNESPGFSTVHAVQYELGLTQRHLIRYLFRWDVMLGDGAKSILAKEAPGCSQSFNKFYLEYEADGNMVRGELFGENYIFIKSARRAMETERIILSKNPRFIDCGRLLCPTCRLRYY